MPQFNRISKFPIANGYSPDQGRFFGQLPDMIITDFASHLPAADESTELVGTNVHLVHPLLGDPKCNFVRVLRYNQVLWIGQAWKRLCRAMLRSSGGAAVVTPLLIESSEKESWVIGTNGMVFKTMPYTPTPRTT